MSDCSAARTQGDTAHRVQTVRLDEASGRARWRTILGAAKTHHMDNVMLRDCIALAMASPEMSGEDVVAHVMRNVQTAPETDKCENTNVVPLFAQAS